MKDYHQADEEMMESGDFQENNNNNMKMTKNYKKGQGMYTGSMGSDMAGSGDMDFQELGNNKKYNNNNYNIQNNNGQGTPIIRADLSGTILPVLNRQTDNLARTNLDEGNNDRQLKAIRIYYLTNRHQDPFRP